MTRRRLIHNSPSPESLASMPPREAWLHDPYRDGTLPTPVDERGLVDFSALLQLAAETVDSEYDWPYDFCDEHHLQWPNSRYKSNVNRKRFRELAISKAVMPRVVHNWIHVITEPPPLPDDDVCQYRIEANEIVRRMAEDAKLSVRLQRREEKGFMPTRRLHYRMHELHEDYSNRLELARCIPDGLLQIEPDEFIALSPDMLPQFAPDLSRSIAVHSLAKTTRVIRRQAIKTAA